MAKYPNKEFQNIYNGIIGSMGTDDELKANIEAALRPLYEQSAEQLRQQRIARNADIDVDAASRGMGNSTWVTDAKLRQLKDESANLAILDANYNNQLYGALADAIKDRDNNAYNQALYWWQNGRKGSGTPGYKPGPWDEDPEIPGITEKWTLPVTYSALRPTAPQKPKTNNPYDLSI